MVRTQIQLQDHQIKWLKRHALKKGVSLAHVIRDSIDFYRSNTEKTDLIRRRKESALAAVGSFSSTDREDGPKEKGQDIKEVRSES